MSTSQNKWVQEITNGLLLALITIVFTLLYTAFTFGTAAIVVFWIVKLLSTLGTLYYFMSSHGEIGDSYTYRIAFKYGFMISFYSAIFIALYEYMHYTVLFPDLESSKIFVESFQKRSQSIDQLTVERVTDKMPIIISICVLIYYSILGLIFSSIMASYIKRQKLLM